MYRHLSGMRKIVFLILTAVLLASIVTAGWYASRFRHINKSSTIELSRDAILSQKLAAHAEKLRNFAVSQNYNTHIAFLVDMSIESGKNRFFVMDLSKNTVINQGLVAHGRCNQNWLTGRKYGNTVGCGCTSLGNYRIGIAYTGRFGRAYKLHGLDTTNSNAYKRFVVLHSYECVPDKETFPLPLCQSDGCPMVSAAFLKTLSVVIDSSKKAVLLSIYE